MQDSKSKQRSTHCCHLWSFCPINVVLHTQWAHICPKLSDDSSWFGNRFQVARCRTKCGWMDPKLFTYFYSILPEFMLNWPHLKPQTLPGCFLRALFSIYASSTCINSPSVEGSDWQARPRYVSDIATPPRGSSGFLWSWSEGLDAPVEGRRPAECWASLTLTNSTWLCSNARTCCSTSTYQVSCQPGQLRSSYKHAVATAYNEYNTRFFFS